tara:strand:- start:3723 stop:4661 length:939 start_codon:yes stop_codon:yes gene_type:complete
MQKLFENWHQYLNQAEQDDVLELAAANLRQIFNLVEQLEKVYKKAPEKHTDLENLRTQNQIFDQVFEPYYNNLDKLTDQQLANKPGPNWRQEYRKIQKLIGIELRKTPELFRKMFAMAKKQNFQLTKEFYEPMLDVFKRELQQMQDNLAAAERAAGGPEIYGTGAPETQKKRNSEFGVLRSWLRSKRSTASKEVVRYVIEQVLPGGQLTGALQMLDNEKWRKDTSEVVYDILEREVEVLAEVVEKLLAGDVAGAKALVMQAIVREVGGWLGREWDSAIESTPEEDAARATRLSAQHSRSRLNENKLIISIKK